MYNLKLNKSGHNNYVLFLLGLGVPTSTGTQGNNGASLTWRMKCCRPKIFHWQSEQYNILLQPSPYCSFLPSTPSDTGRLSTEHREGGGLYPYVHCDSCIDIDYLRLYQPRATVSFFTNESVYDLSVHWIPRMLTSILKKKCLFLSWYPCKTSIAAYCWKHDVFAKVSLVWIVRNKTYG